MLTSSRWLLLALVRLNASAAAEFDKCARASAVWAGLDQGNGVSEAHAVASANGNIYIAGYAMGNLSFHSQHKDGMYKDHAGSSNNADSHTDVTIHHETGSFAGGLYEEHAWSQHGMDGIIYKITDSGEPVKVFGVDVVSSDGITSDLPSTDPNGSENGRFGGVVEFYGIDTFDKDYDMVVGAGVFRGKLTIPMSDGSNKELINRKAYDREGKITAPHFYWGGENGFVTKVNMSSGKAIWATDAGLTIPASLKQSNGRPARPSMRSVATTAAGHVIASMEVDDVVNITKFDGSSGSKLWGVAYDTIPESIALEGDPDEEVTYLTGTLEEKGDAGADPFGTGALRASGDAFVAAIDVSGTDGPVGRWVTQIGKGSGKAVKVTGGHVYAAGTIGKGTYNIGSDCSLTGTMGGYLIKLNKATGVCIWAKDTVIGRYGSMVANSESVWSFESTNSKVDFGDGHIIYPQNDDFIVAKYDASDGTGQWVGAIGGTGRDYLASRGGAGATMTPRGPVFVGDSLSEEITVRNLTINHLQHASPHIGKASWGPNRYDPRGIFAMLLSPTDELPLCIDSCPTGEINAADTTLKSGKCFANEECLDNGAPVPGHLCFKCDVNQTSKGMTGPVYDNHCYIRETCVETHEMRGYYKRWNEASLCEWCDPSVHETDWSLKDGYVHDRTFANGKELGSGRGGPPPNGKPGETNIFGMRFEKESNGCQILPSIVMPASKSADLDAALVPPTNGTVQVVAALAASAIKAVGSATKDNQHVEVAWAHYFGDSVTCTKSGGVCQNTPSALADEMGVAFETVLEPHHESVARVKVIQGLNMLQESLKSPANASPDKSRIDDLKKDIVGHMLMPFYQGAISSAYHMDVGSAQNPPDKATAQTEGKAYWQVIDDTVGESFNAADRAYLSSMFASAASGDFNYCAASTHLLKNLPPVSKLQYVNYVRAESMDAIPSEQVVHLTQKDVGTFQKRVIAGGNQECTMPPPPPSPPPPMAPPPSPIKSSSNSLSDGEIAGIAVGAVVGGIVLLLCIGLVLRTLLFKEAKPIFTCLEKTDAEKATKTKSPEA